MTDSKREIELSQELRAVKKLSRSKGLFNRYLIFFMLAIVIVFSIVLTDNKSDIKNANDSINLLQQENKRLTGIVKTLTEKEIPHNLEKIMLCESSNRDYIVSDNEARGVLQIKFIAAIDYFKRVYNMDITQEQYERLAFDREASINMFVHWLNYERDYAAKKWECFNS